MRRSYTDERFPGIEVQNFGETRFFVVERGNNTVREFTAYETDSSRVSESFAQRRAKDYFDRLEERSSFKPIRSGVSIAETEEVSSFVTDVLLRG